MILIVVFATVQLLFSGVGAQWFDDAFRPTGLLLSEKWKNLLTESLPLLLLIATGIIFWFAGARRRK